MGFAVAITEVRCRFITHAGARLLSCLGMLALALALPARADQTWLASPAITSETPSSWTQPSAMSPDGRYVVLSSAADGWISGVVDVNGGPDVYLWDRLASTRTLVSHAAGDATTAANADSYPAAVSDDGRFILFASFGTDLVAGQVDTNALADVFLWDRDSGEIVLVSHASAAATTAGNARSTPNALSADGRHVVFQSFADNLVAGASDGNLTGDVFVWDRDTSEVTLVSHVSGSAATTGDLASEPSSISADGETVAFSSLATDLLAAGLDTNGAQDAFVWNRSSGTVTLVSHASASTASANSASLARSLSADGRYLVFKSSATNLVPGYVGAAGAGNLFVWDQQTDTTRLISHTPASQTSGAGGEADVAGVTPDGQSIAFASSATSLVAGGSDTNFLNDTFVWRADTGAVVLVSHTAASTTTTGNGFSNPVAISDDGRYVLMESGATNLIAAGIDANGGTDAVRWDANSDTFLLVSHTAAAASTAGNAASSPHAMSANGDLVVLSSSADDLRTGGSDANGTNDAFLWDAATGALELGSRAVSTTVSGANALVVPIALSADGQFGLFNSLATNLVGSGSESNADLDVFHWVRGTETVTLVSHAAGAATTAGNGPAEGVAMSPDGRFVTFSSFASNLIVGSDANALADAFIWDRDSGESVLVSHASAQAGVAANGGSTPVAASIDGRYVAFGSSATNLVAGVTDTNGVVDAFLWDRDSGLVTLISHAAGAALTAGNGSSTPSAISEDGRFVAFYSAAMNLPVGGTDANDTTEDAFLWDRDSGLVTLISHIPSAALTSGNGKSIPLAVSVDGQYVAFASKATNLIASGSDLNQGFDIFHWSRVGGQVSLVSRAASSATAAGDDISVFRAMSADGGFVAYSSASTDVITGGVDANGPNADVYLWNQSSGEVQLVSHAAGDPATTGNGVSEPEALSADGRYLALTSMATDLVPGTLDAMGFDDTYVWDRTTDTMVLASHTVGDAVTTASGRSAAKAMSADGNFLLFASAASDLHPAPGNGSQQGYLWSAATLDATPPVNPQIDSTSPPASTWTNNARVRVTWSGASDEAGGSELFGYSTLWDVLPSTGPDASVDEPHATDPNSVDSPLLSNGNSHYFHLSACDAASNCSAALHIGPFWIDTAPPGVVSGLTSASHPAGTPSIDTTVDVQWTAALDQAGLSGLAGYAFVFDASPSGTCNQTLVAGAGTLGATSTALANGNWYFHICARDNAGNWGSVSNIGPFVIDAVLLFSDGFEGSG